MTSSNVTNSLRARRAGLGVSQGALAERAGISRQALGALESGRSAPSVAVALRLAHALDTEVEALFSVEDEVVVATLAGEGGPRVALAAGDDGWVAHPLAPDALHVPADGLVVGHLGARVRVRLLSPDAGRRLVLLGCDPALGLLAARLDARWLPTPSLDALDKLAAGHAHLAGAHLCEGDEYNAPFVRRRFGGESMCLVHVATAEAGLAVAPGNPLLIRGAADLAGLRVVNRPAGAEARRLLDRSLAEAGVPVAALRGYEREVDGHAAVASTVASGGADAGVTVRAAAEALGLGFVPLACERFDLVVSREMTRDARVGRLVDTLGRRSFRDELAALPGYGTTQTGEVVSV